MNSPERLVLQLPEGLANARLVCNNAASEALAPDPELYVSDWADEHRRLSSKTSAEVGQWQTSRTPYLREIMNALSLAHPASDGDFKKGTQIGGSEAFYNAMGAIIDQSPCPMMLVMPTTDTAKRTSRQRLQPMFDETPSLSAKIGENKSRDASNTVLMKDFPGGMLILAGANSGPGLRSTPVRVLLMDEIDAYPDDVDGEGDPCAVAEKRTTNFSRAKRFACSSPKIKGSSRIDRRYNRGTRAQYFVPCPHCQHEQALTWLQVHWEMDKRRELLCGECAAVTEYHDTPPVACAHCQSQIDPAWLRETPTQDVAEAWYQCEGCNQRIDEHHKTWMLEHGRHIHAAPGPGDVLADDDPHRHAIWAIVEGRVKRYLPRFRRPLSWHVSALYSPLGWYSWRKAVAERLEADKGGYNPESGESLLQVWYNTVLGESYEPPGEQPLDGALKLRAEPYSLQQVPAGGLLLAGSCDVQGDRLEVKVKGYGRGHESWLIDYQRIYYPVGSKKPTEETWQQLLAIRDKGYLHAGGSKIRMGAMAIDTGYLTEEVYAFVRRYAHKLVIATKGQSERGKPLLGRAKKIDFYFNGKPVIGGVQLWPIGTDTGKELVYSRLAIESPGAGYMHFPRGLPDEYYEGLTAEKLIRRQVKGSIINEWVKTRERNEPLDLEILCEAAAIHIGIHRVNWDNLEQVINPGQRDLFTEAAQRVAQVVHNATQAVAAGSDLRGGPTEVIPEQPPTVVETEALPERLIISGVGSGRRRMRSNGVQI